MSEEKRPSSKAAGRRRGGRLSAGSSLLRRRSFRQLLRGGLFVALSSALSAFPIACLSPLSQTSLEERGYPAAEEEATEGEKSELDRSLEERRADAFAAAREWSRRGGSPESTPALETLRTALHDEDATVRAFAAFGLQCVSRDPDRPGLADEVRDVMRQALQTESSLFVRPWLERGLGKLRPSLEQRLRRVLAELALRDVPCHASCSRVSIETLSLAEGLDVWQSHLDQHERDLARIAGRPGWERLEAETRIGEKLFCLALRILRRHSQEIFNRQAKGDGEIETWMERIDDHLRERMLFEVRKLEWEPESGTRERWAALARVFELNEFELVPKPNFHHHTARGGVTAVAFGSRVLPGIVHGLLHDEGRELARAHRLLRLFEEQAELAAPFVIHLWELQGDDRMSRWLGSPWVRYDAIAAGGIETIDLVREALHSDSAMRRSRACLALPRFGGPGKRGEAELQEALADPAVEVRQAAADALQSFQLDQGPRSRAFGLASWLDKNTEANGERSRCLTQLGKALSHEDDFVRAYAARSLARVAREPEESVDRELVRSALGSALVRETSPFVRPWLERGLYPPRLDLFARMEVALSDPRLHRLDNPSARETRPEVGLELLENHWLRGGTEEDAAAIAVSLLEEYGKSWTVAAPLGDPEALRALTLIDNAWREYRVPLARRVHRMLSARIRARQSPAVEEWLALGELYGWSSHTLLPHSHGDKRLRNPWFVTELGDDALEPIVDALVHGNERAAERAHAMLEVLGPRAEPALPFAFWRWGRKPTGESLESLNNEFRASAFALCGPNVLEALDREGGESNVLRATRVQAVADLLRHRGR